MLSGFYKTTSGEIYYKGEPLPLGDPLAVKNLGIETIYQDHSLAKLLNVPDDVFLGRERHRNILGLKILDRKFMKEKSEKALKRLQINLPFMHKPIHFLSGDQRQGVSVGRVLYWNAGVIIMDEPTAVLGIKEKKQVMRLILDLKSNGVTVIIISHEMSDVFEVSDCIAVLYQGKCVGVREKNKTNIDDIARLIITGSSEESPVQSAGGENEDRH